MKIFDLACRTPWAILPDTLTTILEVAARENLSVEAVEKQLGRPLDNTHTVTVRDGVAAIPIDGPIFRHANLFTQISGATSIEVLAQDLHGALIDPAVRAIVLSIDSPGGEVNGVNEFADMIYAARGTKPIISYVSHLGASAAYWIASAADAIVLDATAAVGSIGVVAAVRDPTKERARDIEFVSSQSPNKRPDPTTEKGKAQVQGTVDALADVFIATVARNRGVDDATIARDFGAGGIIVGQAAVDAGMADAVGSFEGVLSALAAGDPVLPAPRPAAVPHPPTTATATGETRMSENPTPPTTATREPSNFDKFMSFLRGESAGAQDASPVLVAGALAPDPRIAQMEAALTQMQERVGAVEAKNTDLETKNAALMTEAATERARRQETEAAAAVDGWITSGKAHRYERETLIQDYLLAVQDDAAHGPVAGADGAPTSRTERLRKKYEAARPHGLLGEAVTEGYALDPQTTTPRAGEQNVTALTEARRRKLLNEDATGRAILEAEDGHPTQPGRATS